MHTRYAIALVWSCIVSSRRVCSPANGRILQRQRPHRLDQARRQRHVRVEDGEIVGQQRAEHDQHIPVHRQRIRRFRAGARFQDRSQGQRVQFGRSNPQPQPAGRQQERVYGYQVEIDTKADRPWTGGIYFEGGSKDKNGQLDSQRQMAERSRQRRTKPRKSSATWANGIISRSSPRAATFKRGSTAFRPPTTPKRMKRHSRQRVSSHCRCTQSENRPTRRKCDSRTSS